MAYALPGFSQTFPQATPAARPVPPAPYSSPLFRTTAAIPASSIDPNSSNPHPASNPHVSSSNHDHGIPPAQRPVDNERLSKRLSLLNLEQNGQKLYVPVESPKLRPTESASLTQIPENDAMQLDDTKHKVYIYDIDAELSSDESDSEGNSRLVFLPDIEKHLKQNRIPPSILANKDGELAGMQMVLYSEPTSLTVPKEKDSVRKAIIEARQRVRQKQKDEREQDVPTPNGSTASPNGAFSASNAPNGFASLSMTGARPDDNDPDAMEVD
ncbi:hypothetical protein GGR52DRAFT_260888 [Hypoxylon sp. FL1284]|nr:hypothetical protein GGR52DRAFT_260888 [Hypoxylon sp. FL1284]